MERADRGSISSKLHGLDKARKHQSQSIVNKEAMLRAKDGNPRL